MYVAANSPKAAQKRKMADSRIKVDFFRRKSATKFLCQKNCQRQSCKAFTGLSNRAQMVGGGRPLKRKFCA